MNEATYKVLEYDKVKEMIANLTVSPAGRSLAEGMKPLTEIRPVEARLNETEETCRLLAGGASIPLSAMEGMENLLALLGKGRVYTEQELELLATWLTSVAQMKRYMRSKTDVAPTVAAYADNLNECPRLREELNRCIRHGQMLDDASPDLAYIRRHRYAAEDKIERKMTQSMGKYRDYLQESVISRRGGRLVLSVKREMRKFVPGSVLDESASGQTLFVEPNDVGGLQAELGEWMAAEERERYAVLAILAQLAEEHGSALFGNREVMAAFDFITARAKWSRSCGGRRAATYQQPVISLRSARHPLLGANCVPLDIELGTEWKQLIITGPNTGGKTVALKTAGLLVLLHQSGLLIPAEENSGMGLFNHVAADVGDGQSLEQSLSTFSAHISVLAGMLKAAGERSLLLLDEMAAGTDPTEGIALSIAVLEALLERGALVAATTHFNEIKIFASSTKGCRNARMAFDSATLKPLYRLEIGEAGESHAFMIARRYGLPERVLNRAEALLERKREAAEDSEVLPAGRRDANEALIGSLKGEEVSFERDLERGNQTEANLLAEVTSQNPSRFSASDRTIESSEVSESKNKLSASDKPKTKAFEKGDSVWIYPLRRAGVVFRPADERGNVVVQVKGEKLTFNRKRLKLYIQKKELYPGEDYDLDIVFETKDNRKARHAMSRKHVEGLEIVSSPGENG